MKKSERFYYGIGALGKDLVYGFSAGYIMYYLNDVLGISALFLGSLFLFARAFDAINDPIMGMIVDNTRSKFGKFRPWIFLGTLMNAFVLVALFSVPNLSGNTLLIYASVFYILWGITYTIMDIPYWSLIPALSRSQKDRENIAVVARVFAAIGFTIVTVATIPLVGAIGQGDRKFGFSVLAIIIALIFITFSTITCLKVREHVTVDQGKISLKKMYKILLSNDQLFVVMITVVLFNVSTYITTTLGIYFFKYDIGNENLYSIFAGVAGIAQILAMLFFPVFSKYLTRKQIFTTSIGISVLGYLSMFIEGQLGLTSVGLLFASGFFIFIGLGLMNILTTAMLADTVEYGEWKQGIRSESIVFSVQTFIVKLASAVSAFIVGVGLTLIQFVPEQVQSVQTLTGLRSMMFIMPIFGLLLSVLIYRKKYIIDEAFYNRIVDEITTRENTH